MGIHSREYFRDDRARPSFRGVAGSSVITALIVVNAVVFIAQEAPFGPTVTDWLRVGTAHRIAADLDPVTLLQAAAEGVPADALKKGERVMLLQRNDSTAVVYSAKSHFVVELPIKTVAADYLVLAEIWRVLTYGFCHGGITHIFFNMLTLWIFGRLVEPVYGAREFLAFYLAAIVASGVGFILVQLVLGVDALAIGASGGVMAVTIMAAMLYPREKVLMFLVIPIEFRWLAVIYMLGDLSGMTGQGVGTNIAHSAHLAGALFGFLYVRYNWRLSPYWDRLTSRTGGLRLPRRRPKVKIYEPSTQASQAREPVTRAALSAQVDAILEKIHEHGEASLTDDERQILKEASRRFKR